MITIEEAKGMLREAKWCILAISRELDRIDSIWQRLITPRGPSYSEKISGTDQSGFLSKILDLISEREEIVATYYRKTTEVERILLGLSKKNIQEAKVLDMHYIQGLTYDKIGEALHYSRQGIYNLSRRAIEDFAEIASNSKVAA